MFPFLSDIMRDGPSWFLCTHLYYMLNYRNNSTQLKYVVGMLMLDDFGFLAGMRDIIYVDKRNNTTKTFYT